MSEIENATNVSDNTSNFIYESLLQDIIYLSNNNIFIIPKAIEQKYQVFYLSCMIIQI